MGLGVAVKAFFRALFDREFAATYDQWRQRQRDVTARPAPVPEPVASGPKPGRSEALTLLAALQREARLVDFLQEELTGYDDAQIGASVRDIHRDCAAAIERMFALQPLREQAEGSPLEIAAGFDPAQVKLVGNVTGQPPFRGTLAHPGWRATRCEIPAWIGHETAAQVIAPAEVEIP